MYSNRRASDGLNYYSIVKIESVYRMNYELTFYSNNYLIRQTNKKNFYNDYNSLNIIIILKRISLEIPWC